MDKLHSICKEWRQKQRLLPAKSYFNSVLPRAGHGKVKATEATSHTHNILLAQAHLPSCLDGSYTSRVYNYKPYTLNIDGGGGSPRAGSWSCGRRAGGSCCGRWQHGSPGWPPCCRTPCTSGCGPAEPLPAALPAAHLFHAPAMPHNIGICTISVPLCTPVPCL